MWTNRISTATASHIISSAGRGTTGFWTWSPSEEGLRDTEDEFAGAEFRDDETKLMFAYDYENKFTIRVWGSTFKPALYKEPKRLEVKVYDRTEATSLLVSEEDGARRRRRGLWG